MIISEGPSVDQLFDEQEKVQRSRRQLIHSFKPVIDSLSGPQKLAASKIQSEARKISVKIIEFSLRGISSDKDKATQSIDSLIDSLQSFESNVDLNNVEIRNILSSASSYLDTVEVFLHLSSLRSHPVDQVYAREAEIHQARKLLIQSLYPLIDEQYKNLDQVGIDTSNSIENADFIQKISSAAFIALSVILGYILSKMIIRPISDLNLAVRQIGEGKYDTNVIVNSNNEIGELSQAFNDMSSNLQRSNDRIEYMAYYDGLTGLANRRLLINRLEQTLASSTRHHHQGALLMLDLDRFKNINDSLGHAAGDLLLKKAAERLSDILREEDTVCRLGGDEFVILLPLMKTEDEDVLTIVARIAEKVRESLARPYLLDSSYYTATPSVGIVMFPHPGDDAVNLLKRADAAMYRSKREGGNKVSFYEKSIQQAADERLLLEKDLQTALQNDELFMVYQPQCNTSGEIVGVEALIRWDHSERGLIPPPKFIEIAEETGMIVTLGNWILDRVCSQISTVIGNSGETLRSFSVNVSAYQFRDQTFCDTVLKIVEKYKIPPSMLQIELTETAFLDDIEITSDRLQQLRSAGIRCSLDDFGTGYSSLSYLSKLPLDELKIDRSFLIDAESNQHAWSIIEAIIDVADALKLQVVAEGVELQEQVDRLGSINCHVFQGYNFYKPLAFEDFQKLLMSKD